MSHEMQSFDPENENVPEVPLTPEEIKKGFAEQMKVQGNAMVQTLKLGMLAGFLGSEDIKEIQKSWEEAGWPIGPHSKKD